MKDSDKRECLGERLGRVSGLTQTSTHCLEQEEWPGEAWGCFGLGAV